MNKTVVFLAVVVFALAGIICATVLMLIRPEGFLTFTGFIGTTIISITGFATLFYGLNKVNDKAEVAVKNTNGNLEKRDNEIAALREIVIQTGHADKLKKETA